MWNRKNEQAADVLSDLIKINDERIKIYKYAIDKASTFDIELKKLFNEIVSESEKNKQQLSRITMLFNSNNLENNVIITGKIYKAWADLRVNFAGITRRSFMSACQYNEDITKHAYLAALSSNSNINVDIRDLLEEQMDKLNTTNMLVKRSREVRHFTSASLMYFN